MAKKPVTAATGKGSAFGELGVPGFESFGGMITSNEKSSDLKDQNKYKTFSQLLADAAVVSTGVRTFLTLISNSQWTVKPAEVDGVVSPEAQKVADFITDCMDDMATPWYRHVRRCAMYRFYGFSVQEWTAKRRLDGKIGMLDIEARPQITIQKWQLDERNKVIGCIQTSPQTQEEIPIPRWKIIYAVDDTLNDSPEGLGLFRHLVSRNRVLQRYEQLEGQGFEGDLRGTPIMKAPIEELSARVKAGSLDKVEFDKIKNAITSFLQSHVNNPGQGKMIDSAVWRAKDEAKSPSGSPKWAVELLSGGGQSFEHIANAIRRVMFEMAMILGVESLLLGANGIGSLALSRDKSQRLYMLVDSTLQELAEVFEHDFIWPLMQLNGFSAEHMPSFETEAVQYREVGDVTGALRDLSTSGAPILPGDPVVDEIRAMVGLSPVPEDLIADESLLGSGDDNADDVAEEDENSDVPDKATEGE